MQTPPRHARPSHTWMAARLTAPLSRSSSPTFLYAPAPVVLVPPRARPAHLPRAPVSAAVRPSLPPALARAPAPRLHAASVATASSRATPNRTAGPRPPAADPHRRHATTAATRAPPLARVPPCAAGAIASAPGGGRRATSVAARASAAAPEATLSPPAGRARARSHPALALARALVRTTLPLRTPEAGAVRVLLAGEGGATAATTSATVVPGRPGTKIFFVLSSMLLPLPCLASTPSNTL